VVANECAYFFRGLVYTHPTRVKHYFVSSRLLSVYILIEW